MTLTLLAKFYTCPCADHAQKYRAHRHCGFACTGPTPPALLALGVGRGPACAATVARGAAPVVAAAAAVVLGDSEATGAARAVAAIAAAAVPPAQLWPPAVEFWTRHAAPQGPQGGAADSGRSGSEEEVTAEGVLRVRLPVPYGLPPALYGPEDRPWTVDGRHEGADALGVVIED